MTDKNEGVTAAITRQSAASQDRTAIHELMDAHRRQFEMALMGPTKIPMLDADHFMRVALSEVLTNTPKLMKATPASLIGAVLTCAALGLEPGGPLGHAYLIPYENRQSKVVTAKLILGYRGYIDLAYRSDRVASIEAETIHEADYLQFEKGTNAHLIHRPQLDDRGEVIGAYAIAELVGGAKPFAILSKTDIEARRSHGQNTDGKDSPWMKHYEAMARKSAVRQLFKWLPSSVVQQSAIAADGSVWKQIPERPLDDIHDPNIIDVEGSDVPSEGD